MKRVSRLFVQVPTTGVEVIEHDNFGPMFTSQCKWVHGFWVAWAQDQGPAGGAVTPLNIDFEQEPAVGAWPVPGVDMTSIQIGACQREYIPVGDSRFPRISLWENVGSDGTACLEVIWDDGLEVRYG